MIAFLLCGYQSRILLWRAIGITLSLINSTQIFDVAQELISYAQMKLLRKHCEVQQAFGGPLSMLDHSVTPRVLYRKTTTLF